MAFRGVFKGRGAIENKDAASPFLPMKRRLEVQERLQINEETRNMLELLKNHQKEEECDYDVAVFLEPYIKDCLINLSRGESAVSLEVFLDKRLCCKRCYHGDHVEGMCAQKCCNTERCARCFHEHKAAICDCLHTQKFIETISVKLGL